MQNDVTEARLVADARAVYDAAVRGASAERLVGRVDWTSLARRPLASYERIHLLAAGKAALAMSAAVERALAGHATIDGGLAVVPHGYLARRPSGVERPRQVEVVEAGHPLPDATSTRAAERALALAHAAGAHDLVLVLLSGGASSLWTLPADPLTLDDLRATSTALLRSGASIAELNAVRKHLSRVGGGRLAAAAHPAEVCALVVSDVVGDDLSVIGSGPTVGDPTTFADALGVLRRRDLLGVVPNAARVHLERGAEGAVDDTPSADDPRLAAVRTQLVGRNDDALDAAAAGARRLGYDVRVVARGVTGEAREHGRAIADEVARVAASAERSVCLLWGGETVVTVRGGGRGGRNQEVALAAALALDPPDGARCRAILSGGTDGIDGPTDAAGAVVTAATIARLRERGVDAAAALNDNDAYTALDAADALLRTGPTHTNVVDVQIALVRHE